MNDRKQSFNIYPDNIVNYRNKGDYFTITSTKNNLGISKETKTKVNSLGSLIDIPHLGENIGDLNKAKTKNMDFAER